MTEAIAVAAPAQHARRRRRRWPWVVLSLIVVLGLLALAAEAFARSLVPNLIRDQVVSALDLPAGQGLEVQTSGFLLGQIIAGKLDAVHLSADSVTLGGLTGSLEVTALGVPIDGGPIDDIRGTIGITADQIHALLVSADLPLDEVRLAEGRVTLTGTVRVIFVDLPIMIEVEPHIEDGDLLLRPYAFELGTVRLDAQGLIEQLGPIGEQYTAGFPVCIADQLPRAVDLLDLELFGDIARIDFRIDGAITVDETLQRPGTCPAR